jgi:amidase
MVLYDPRPEQVIASAARRGLTLSESEAALLIELGRDTLAGCARVAAEPAQSLPVRYPRRSGRRPSPEENQLNAWAWRCDIRGADEGVLAGRTVVLKDIIPVAGQPMSAGSAILEGHVPSFDSTVTSRVLDQGGRIVGIAATEDMCLSGASVSAVTGYVRNPRDPSRSAGGSSSGVAALIGSGAVDVGIGADQGGSIRIPASLSGVFGLKPTYGLIPYTGCAPIDPSLDHLGPMAGTVEDLARLLQAIAGFDEGLDPRQRADMGAVDYLAGLSDADPTGLRVGLLRQGFNHPGLSDPQVDDAVRSSAEALARLGAQVREADVPLHRRAMDIHGSLLLQGVAQYMVGSGGVGPIGKGFYDETVGSASAAGMALRGDQLFASVKFAVGIGGYLWDAYGGAYYAKAQNLAVSLRREMDRVLREVDILIMPTTCVQAPELPVETVPGLRAVQLALDPALISNTCAFNHTGHPALSVPIGPVGNLPVGLMLVAQWYDEATLLRTARALEQAGATYRPGMGGAA